MSYRFRHYASWALAESFFFKKHLQRFFQTPVFSADDYKRMKKINLASSDHIIPGWINVDIRKIPGVDYVVDVRDLSVFPDASFDLVRASHVLEHFYVNELEKIMNEWNRILRPNGRMIICVPDFDLTLIRYFVNPHSINPCLVDEFGTSLLSQIYGFDYSVPENNYYKHKMVYNRKSLTAIMKTYGKLKNIRTFNYLLEEPYTIGVNDDSTNVYSLNLVGQK